ncbi:antibiotic biosynthesis monooxygenase family protein [Nocardia salmonicida]|uniref:antibiotic biosynthesis monooxygenase family protein n=1 Tax=Nocardia salmonicida TaxID=53431 RepID=UPI00362DA017
MSTETPSTARQFTAPVIDRADAHTVYAGLHHVSDNEHARTTLADLSHQWTGAPWQPGLLSLTSYLSTDGDTVLTYAQAAADDSYPSFTRELSGVAGAEPVRYRFRRGIRTGTGVPGCVVIATFDVDGPGRQDAVVDALLDTLSRVPGDGPPGMLSANFHVSADGSRVLNYAEWVSDEAHLAFLEGSTRKATLSASTRLPGVRPIGFRRFHLHHTLSR